MRMWRTMVVTTITLFNIEVIEAQSNGCPAGQFSVSVLDNPVVQCLASRPCSGVYGYQGLLSGVGSCPANAGCALLPHHPTVMGCVIAGRPDVSYVNPDGSLSRGGQIIAPPPNNNGGNNNGGNNNGGDNNGGNNNGGNNNPGNNNGGNNNGGDNNPGNNNGGNNNPENNNGGNNNPGINNNGGNNNGGNNTGGGDHQDGSGNADKSKTVAPGTTQPYKEPTHSGSHDHSISSSSGATVPMITPHPLIKQNTANKSSLDDINGDKNSKQGDHTTNGMGLGSIVGIILGCLAILAFIAGVFFLRRKKEEIQEPPPPGLEEYGTGCVTPKENVLLL